MSEPTEEHDLGLVHDLPSLLNRRRALGLLSATGLAAALAACTPGSDNSVSPATPSADLTTTATSPATTTGAAPADEVPEETGGPYPSDGSNGPDALELSGIVRSDLRTSLGTGTTAEGVVTTVNLRIWDMDGSDATPLAGAALYLWHCDREGRYSMYSPGVEDEDYLRGVQVSDADGRLSFTTVFPACYPGRWPHMHFEVYPGEADAITGSNKMRTSQLALPHDVCEAVYATEGYQASVQNLSQLSLDTDGIFSDGYSLQLAKVTGSARDGYTVELGVAV